MKDEDTAARELSTLLVEAVRKRVQTDLPIGVFLSGGVDSSLIMEIATRLHPDVTAIILGYPGSSDYEFAVRLCQDRGYKHHIVHPDADYDQDLDDIIYHLETYEPQIIRHGFSMDICSREANRLGLKVVLVGEGADEIFGGYNEFGSLPDRLINTGSKMLLESLHSGHLQRVDRMSMKHTVEVRAPFFDRAVVEFGTHIHGSLKLRRVNHQITTKYVLRKAAADFLPDYTVWRYKVPFSNGAGMNVGNNFKSQDGDVAKAIMRRKEPTLPKALTKRYGAVTREEKYDLARYHEHHFTKLLGSEQRLVVKDNLGGLYKSKKTRLMVAEFGRLAGYFPVYYASQKNLYRLHGLDVDFVATGGDDRTYASLVNNSAHVGLADPMFAMMENREGVRGEIIGELINRVANVAVTINPAVAISSLADFAKYKIGTFQEFSTTHEVAKYFLPTGTTIRAYDYKDLMQGLIDRTVDVAIVIPEQAYELAALGGRLVFDFATVADGFLFTGFTSASTLEAKYRPALYQFIAATREGTRHLLKDREEAFSVFARMFPQFKQPRRIFDHYAKGWSSTIKVDPQDYAASHKMWKHNHPELLKEYLPYFRTTSPADAVLEKIQATRTYRADFPFLEDTLRFMILDGLKAGQPLNLFGFWGAGPKAKADALDHETIRRFGEYVGGIKKVYGPGVKVTFILADAHAAMNGYEVGTYGAYLKEMRSLLANEGYETMLLSNLWDKWGLSQKKINDLLKEKKAGWWDDVPLRARLEASAEKRPLGGDAVTSSQRYYAVRLAEKKLLEKEFKGQVFFAFSDGQMQPLYPTLPTLYLYSMRKGTTEAPWFAIEASRGPSRQEP
jgi:ABC-type nitrate/sulfonate/bicarbonate transport system substrate-binding protein